MPIKPVSGMEVLPVEQPSHVAALVDLLGQPGSDTRGLGDHFAYVAGVRPEWFRPFQEVVIAGLLDRLDVSFADLCLLLADAPDRCVDQIARRMRDKRSFVDTLALAAIGTDAALAAVAEDVRFGGGPEDYADSGVWVPPTGPAQRRFTPHRRAVRLRPSSDPANADHPVGLSLTDVLSNPQNSPVTWHYLSLRLADIPGLPFWPAERVHVVGVPAVCMWEVTAAIDELGRYDEIIVDFDDRPNVEEEAAYRFEARKGRGHGAVDLIPYDEDLVYSNGHIQLTPGVVGTAGGPPMGTYQTPRCPTCARLMFHVVTVENLIREYGDGWRSLFICEECRLVTCTATGWN